jgi:hypothetical protein
MESFGPDSFAQIATNASELIEWPEDLPTPLFNREHTFTNRNALTPMSTQRLRSRRMFTECIEMLHVQWNFTNDQFHEFKKFFDTELNNGEGNFIMVTYDESPTAHFIRVVTRELNFYGATYSGNRQDNLHAVSATLEVVDSDVYEIENKFDPLPPPVVNPLPTPQAVFPSPLCRDEFAFSFDSQYDLQLDTVYGIEISDSATGIFYPHVYFGLVSAVEKSTRLKTVTFNNDYNGAAWFRVVRIRNAIGDPDYAILSQPVNPAASVVSAPTVSLDHLTEISTSDQVSALGTLSTGVVSLHRDGPWVVPYSSKEDPMIWLSTTYRRAQKKYIQRQQGSFDTFGDMNGISPENGINRITMTGPAGALFSYTRDQSDPQIDTYMPALNGTANNAMVQDHRFSGVLKVRCFVGGCRSPLTTILVDKMMREIPVMPVAVTNKAIFSSCDYPNIDPVSGLPVESGDSCNLNYGGDCSFELQKYNEGTSGGSPATSRWDGSQLVVQSRSKTRNTAVYLGFTIDAVSVSYIQFSGWTWTKTSNFWSIAPRTHNWGVTDLFATVIEGIGPTDTFCGSGAAVDAATATFLTFASIITSASLPQPPAQACNQPLSFTTTTARFDILRATQWRTNLRDEVWDSPTFTPPAVPVVEPPAVIVPVVPFDDFESYLDGDATAMTLSFNTAIDWNEAWTIRAGATTAQTGYDTFEEYANGSVPDFSTHITGDGYIPYNGGEAWEAVVEWHVTTPLIGIAYSEPWTGYSDGALSSDAQVTTNGWMTGSGEGWHVGTALVTGLEDFSTYVDGAFTGAATGSNFVASESWIAR